MTTFRRKDDEMEFFEGKIMFCGLRDSGNVQLVRSKHRRRQIKDYIS